MCLYVGVVVCVCVCVCSGLCSYPEWVSFQWSHHGHEERLLQQSEQGTDQRLHPCQTAELTGRVPAGNNTVILIVSSGELSE